MIGSMNKGAGTPGSGQGLGGLSALFRNNSAAAGPVPGSMAPMISAPQRPTIAPRPMAPPAPAAAQPSYMSSKDYNAVLASRNPTMAMQAFLRTGGNGAMSPQQQLTFNQMSMNQQPAYRGSGR